jgi:hypothetical protein
MKCCVDTQVYGDGKPYGLGYKASSDIAVSELASERFQTPLGEYAPYTAGVSYRGGVSGNARGRVHRSGRPSRRARCLMWWRSRQVPNAQSHSGYTPVRYVFYPWIATAIQG